MGHSVLQTGSPLKIISPQYSPLPPIHFPGSAQQWAEFLHVGDSALSPSPTQAPTGLH